MPFRGFTLDQACGYGGCQAPVRPVPVSCPGFFGDKDDEVGQPFWLNSAGQRDLVVFLAQPRSQSLI